jgi:hypothetical protein
LIGSRGSNDKGPKSFELTKKIFIMGSLEDLVVYQKAVELRQKLKPISHSFPP